MSEVVGYAALLALAYGLIIMIARGERPLVRRIIYIVVAFWLLSYVIRPVVMTALSPTADQLLFDRRLYQTGYAEVMVRVEQLALVSALTFAGVLWATRRRTPQIAENWQVEWPNRAAWVLVALGWAARVVIILGIGVPFPLDALESLATVGAIMVVLSVEKWNPPPLVVWVLAGSQLLWAVESASKTPILMLLLAVCVRLPWRGFSLRTVLMGVLAGTVLFAVFALIQPIKGIGTAAEAASEGSSPLAAQSLAILERADLSKAVTDSIFYPDRPWLSPSEYVRTVSLAAVPKWRLFDYTNISLRWTREVRAASLSDQQPEVHLATGVVAEGYIEAGEFGVLLQTGFLVVFIRLLGGLVLGGRPIRVAFGVSVLFNTTIFEGGVLGASEMSSKAIQAAIVAGVASVLFMGPRERAALSSAAGRRSNSGTALR